MTCSLRKKFEMSTYAEYQLIEEAKEKLVAAFLKNAALRSKRLELERQIEKVNEKLNKTDDVDAVVNDPRYSDIAAIKDPQFLRDVEQGVADSYRRRSKRFKASASDDAGGKRKRLSVEEKRRLLADICEQLGDEPLLVSSMAPMLMKHGVSAQPTQFIAACDVPKNSLKPVTGAKRDGTHFFPSKVSWLKELKKIAAK